MRKSLSHLSPLTPGAALALALLAIPAAGQAEENAPACAAGRDVTWIGPDLAGSTLSGELAPERLVESRSGATPGVFAFRVEGELRLIRAELGQRHMGDPMLKLVTAAGSPIAENDDWPGTVGSRIEADLSPGDYCLLPQELSGGALHAMLRVSEASAEPLVFDANPPPAEISCGPETEATDLDATALTTALRDLTRVSETLDGAQAAHFRRFTLGEGATFSITARSEQLDPQILLFDDQGGRVAENDDADGTDSRLDFAGNLPAGRYCLAVRALSPAPGDITLAIGGIDAAQLLREAYRNGTTPPAADSGYEVIALDLGTADVKPVLLGNSALWFSFELSAPEVVILSASGGGSGVDSRLALFDRAGRQIAENDDTHGLDPELGPVLLEPGRYSLALSDTAASGRSAGGQLRVVTLTSRRFIEQK